MPGTKSSGRPGGNPELRQHSYQIQDPDRNEAYTEQLQLRVTPTMHTALKALGKSKNEFIRDAIAEKLARSQEQAQENKVK